VTAEEFLEGISDALDALLVMARGDDAAATAAQRELETIAARLKGDAAA
jgi:hypothetical protein